MIRASELRIGNLVEGVRIGKVKSIFNTHFQVDDFDCITLGNSIQENFKPIPLTEEWLVKFGFKNHLDTIWIYWSKEAGLFEISTRLPQGSYGLWINGTMGCFEYVHQLQNLFFALTGEELTIKNK